MDLGLKGKVALVTGGARGIGKQIAEDLAKEGCTIVLFDMGEEALAQAKTDIDKITACDTFTVNVTDHNAVLAAVDKIVDKHGKLDILVNNAGITRDGLFLRMKEEDWDAVLNVNLKGAFNCSKAAVKHMVKARTGRIINMASVIALMGNVGQTNYGASKAALIGFSKSLAREVASRNITVNAIAPGFIKTAMTDKIPAEIAQKMVDSIPMARMGDVKDISNAVLFFASDMATYVTGKTLTVDGGML